MATTLRFRNQGSEVRHLQKLLNQLLKPSPHLDIDGDFGPRTEKAVRLYQATVGLGIDGIAGPYTWAAMQKKQVTSQANTASVPPIFSKAPWMAVAMKEIGHHEVPGAGHNPRIITYHATTTLSAKTDETPWCSSFVNWCLQQVGITGTNSAAAASWLSWGQASAHIPGAITVIYYSRAANSSFSASGNHVGFLARETTTHYKLLGGNQRDQVKISSYPKKSWKLRGCRLPNQQILEKET